MVYRFGKKKQEIIQIEVGTERDITLYAKWQTVFILNGGTITGLTAYGKTCSEIIIDSVINGTRITSIDSYAFRNCSGLTSIAIPDSVTSIDNSTFRGCSKLQYNVYDNAYYLGNDINPYLVLTMPKSNDISSCTVHENTKVIADSAFRDCSGLTSVTIPDSVTSIGNSAFYGCSGLTSVTIPDSITSIGNSAFYGCSGLTSVTIPDSVTSIGSSAFSDCSNLTNIFYNGDIASWCSISGLGSLMSYSSNKKLYIKGEEITELIIPNSVTSIASAAFSGCSGLTSFTIPDGVTSIGQSAFEGCSGLTKINYGGTKAQWNSVSKGSYWNYKTGNYTVVCTDGEISK